LILRLVWENIRFRPMRTLLSVLLIGVPVMLILTLVGVSTGFMEDSQRRTQGVGADIIVRPPNSSYASFNGSPMPEAVVDVLAKVQHVRQAMGVVTALGAGKMFWDSVAGIDYPAFKSMSGGFIFDEGDQARIFRQPGDIVVDTDFARQQRPIAHLGSKVKLLNHYWNVVAVVETGKMAHAFVQKAELQELANAIGHDTQIYLKLDDPNNVPQVLDALDKLIPTYSVQSVKAYLDLITAANPQVGIFINVIIGIGVFTGLIVVSLSMYMAVLQRTREIGILKSLGATKAFVMSLILWEACAMGIGGTIVGIGLSFATKAVLGKFLAASLPQAIVIYWWPRVLGIALGSALLGAIYPGMIAVRQDPIEALAYE
jgi:putative ABC transport system permease protein